MQNIIVYDDFYNNVNEVRNLALSQEFNVDGNYPGMRTQSLMQDSKADLMRFFETVTHEKIKWFGEGYNGAFQVVLEGEDTWIHCDQTNWAAVVFLSPNAPLESGTSFYRHKETGWYEYWNGCPRNFNEDAETAGNLDLWEEATFVGNIYNRIVIYRSNLYHRSKLPGFGTDKYNGRLTQTFFFDTDI